MKRAFSFLALIFIAGCSQSINDDEFFIISGLYCTKQYTPITGNIVRKFANGRIAEKTSIKKGIPNGTWFTYGYKSEVLQHGEYRPITLRAQHKNVLRIQEFIFSEFDYHDTSYYVIVTGSLQPSDTNSLIKMLRDENGLEERKMRFSDIEFKPMNSE